MARFDIEFKKSPYYTSNYRRYSVTIDGSYVGWVVGDDNNRTWSVWAVNRWGRFTGTQLGSFDSRLEAAMELTLH